MKQEVLTVRSRRFTHCCCYYCCRGARTRGSVACLLLHCLWWCTEAVTAWHLERLPMLRRLIHYCSLLILILLVTIGGEKCFIDEVSHRWCLVVLDTALWYR